MAEVEIDFDVPVPMRDGTILRADVYRPTGTGPRPVLVQRTPYDKRSPVNAATLDTLLAAARGYIVVQQDTRGRFASDGQWSPWTHEHADGHDTVRWAAKLPGSSGVVGMFGASYMGNTSWFAAIDGPLELRAIAPQVTWSEPNDGRFMRGGAVELGLNAWWMLFTGLGDLTSSSFPRWDRNPNTGESSQTATTLRPARQRIFHDASRTSLITLPVVSNVQEVS